MPHFLHDELAHAERQLARVRRLQQQLQATFEAQGLAELAIYEALAATKTYRQLQRDELFYQQMWLRLQRYLAREAPAAARAEPRPTQRQPQQQQQQQPSRNQLCPCGSGLKYKRCCVARPAPALQRAA